MYFDVLFVFFPLSTHMCILFNIFFQCGCICLFVCVHHITKTKQKRISFSILLPFAFFWILTKKKKSFYTLFTYIIIDLHLFFVTLYKFNMMILLSSFCLMMERVFYHYCYCILYC